MKLLIVSPHYYPEQFKITEIAESLSKDYEVTVLTNIPNYPEGSFYSGYGYTKKRTQNINGVHIKRIGVIPRKKSKLFLALNYLSFMFLSSLWARFTKRKFDLVFTYQLSPVTVLRAGNIYAKRRKVKHIGYVLDLWPNSLKVINIKETSFIYKVLKKVSYSLYKKVDKLLVSSYSFKDFFIKNDITNDKNISYLPNFGEMIFENKIKDPNTTIRFDQENVNVLFAGNIGKAQNLSVLIDLAVMLKENSYIHNVVFQIVGDGSEKQNLEQLVQENELQDMFVFHGRKPITQMPNYYLESDILFFSLLFDDVISLTLPGKVQSYMAVGKPIFSVSQGESKEILAKYKYSSCVDVLDKDVIYSSFIDFVEKYKSELLDRDDSFYKNNFTKEIVIDNLKNILSSAIKED